MDHFTSTALVAGARKSCADSAEHSLPGMGSIIQQPSFRPVLRREIMAAVNICGRDLGLRQAAVVVLDALLSCLPCQSRDGREATVSPAILLTIYASNETLCFRAKGLTDRQLRRHLETLEKAGLICRRDSANGKRFPVMQRGKAIGAFGLDLSPLFARADELIALAQKRREEMEELRGLKAQILRLRAACCELRLNESLTAFLNDVRNLVRRTGLTLLEARNALNQLTTMLSQNAPHAEPDPAPEQNTEAAPVTITGNSLTSQAIEPTKAIHNDRPTANAMNTQNFDQTPACDGQNVRHIKTKSDTKKRKAVAGPSHDWRDLTEISAFYAEPKTERDATAIAFEFGRMLRISHKLLATAAEKLGLWGLLRLQDRMAGQVASILNPDSYLQSVLRS